MDKLYNLPFKYKLTFIIIVICICDVSIIISDYLIINNNYYCYNYSSIFSINLPINLYYNYVPYAICAMTCLHNYYYD